ncbi:hypothetical protein CAPTEDRAFT_194464 [Capitella teleta]|uniref:Uncharacterized protein n=1 Tax=Capitella teleta TaxID=283909 RepID=R7UL31_CAPTE|nr:hypothetical protein CAPTEDRAFT_194464 [Capitella teleta]|eukprot:ELU06818.1 hypothetical protein CAPTEDRAFT_194464 [Capitella teleta]
MKYVRKHIKSLSPEFNVNFKGNDEREANSALCYLPVADCEVDGGKNMPSSHLQWSPVRVTPIFNVFGSKRKATENDSSVQMADEGFTAKRRCLLEESSTQQQQQQQQPQDQPMDSMELNHNDVHLPNQHLQRVEQQQQPRVPSPWPLEAMTHQAPQVNTAQFNMQEPLPPQPASGGGIMELSDETFNMEAAQSVMESDFVPDNQQYAADPSYCREFCG